MIENQGLCSSGLKLFDMVLVFFKYENFIFFIIFRNVLYIYLFFLKFEIFYIFLKRKMHIRYYLMHAAI